MWTEFLQKLIEWLYSCVQQVAAEVAAPLSQAKKITMVSSGSGEVGAAKLTGEVLAIVNKVPELVKSITGVDITRVRWLYEYNWTNTQSIQICYFFSIPISVGTCWINWLNATHISIIMIVENIFVTKWILNTLDESQLKHPTPSASKSHLNYVHILNFDRVNA